MCGVASAICGESMTFDELMTLANAGRAREVDIHAGELKSAASSGLYQAVPEDMMAFAYVEVTEKHPSKCTVLFRITCRSPCVGSRGHLACGLRDNSKIKMNRLSKRLTDQ